MITPVEKMDIHQQEIKIKETLPGLKTQLREIDRMVTDIRNHMTLLNPFLRVFRGKINFK